MKSVKKGLPGYIHARKSCPKLQQISVQKRSRAFVNGISASSPKSLSTDNSLETHQSVPSYESNPLYETAFDCPISPRMAQSGLSTRPGIASFSILSSNHRRLYTHLSHPIQGSKAILKSAFRLENPTSAIQRLQFSSQNSGSVSDSSSSNATPVTSTVNPKMKSAATIDAGTSIRKPISLWPGMYHSPVTNALWEARSSMFEKVIVDNPKDEVSGHQLVPKTPSRSRTSIVYKFFSDYVLREQYRNPWNEIRMGKLIEDLDALAGTISFKHCSNDDGTTKPMILVTASVDRTVLKKPIIVDADINIVGAVTWVGRSSMEIQLEVNQPKKDSESLALVANFTFVARDVESGKSTLINRIMPESEQEKLLWREAEERNRIQKQKRAERKRDPGKDDNERLNALLAEGRVFSDMPALADRDSILMRDTCHENSLICQPQQRNIQGRIFGGFLMRKAFELAFSTAYAFAGAAPRFLEVDRVDFFKPVDVGNFLRLKSRVLYTELENLAQPLINLEVVAHVTKPERRSSEVSNTFYFTFSVRQEGMKDGLRIRNVVPATEEEARRVLERMDAERPTDCA